MGQPVTVTGWRLELRHLIRLQLVPGAGSGAERVLNSCVWMEEGRNEGRNEGTTWRLPGQQRDRDRKPGP